jgi:glycerophosphoryl diester phosphodiesterase
MQQPLIYAHRGASAHAPENTIAAFLLAIEHGADGIEFDIKVTSDGKVIVLHDQTLQRTTTGSGDLKKFTYNELRKLDAGSKFSEKYSTEKLPTLEEVFEAVGTRIGINIELTNYATPGDDLIEKVAKILASVKDTSKVMFSSFNWGNLNKARKLCPEIPCGILALPGIAGWLSRSFFTRNVPHEAIHPYFADIGKKNVNSWHQQGYKVNIWTVNNPKEMLRLKDLGVDMIMTDDPALANTTLRSLG